jgi:hypothetical protein
MKKFLNKKKNNIISEEIGGGCKVINAWGAVGERMNPWNMWFLMCCFDILRMHRFARFFIGERK